MNILLLLLAGITSVLAVKYFLAIVRTRKSKHVLAFFIWVGVTAVALHPPLVYVINEWFGLGTNLNSIIFMALVLLYMLVFSILRNQEKIRRDITQTVRQIALSEHVRAQGVNKDDLPAKDSPRHVSRV